MSAVEKQIALKKLFLSFSSPDEKYQKIIELGRALPPLSPVARTPANLVQGCQSTLYLETRLQDGLIYFCADSEALISKGLAALLIHIYSGEPPESLFQAPPLFLQEIGLFQALSPSRSSGLLSLYKKMQQEAVSVLKRGIRL
jgi:cysteine desulfuration protein SufE